MYVFFPSAAILARFEPIGVSFHCSKFEEKSPCCLTCAGFPVGYFDISSRSGQACYVVVSPCLFQSQLLFRGVAGLAQMLS